MGFQLKQLQDQIVKMQKDTDFRLQELEAAPAGKKPLKKTEVSPQPMDPGSAAPPPASLALIPAPGTQQAPPGSGEPVAMGDDPSLPPGTIGQPPPAQRPAPWGGPQVLGAPPQILGQIPKSDDPLGGAPTDGPIDLSQGQPQAPVYQRPSGPIVAPVPGVAPKYANVQPVPTARDEYDSAYGYILNGEYDLAERSFKTFLANHPTDRRAGSAQYWLGESYFQRNMHREATDAFLKSYTQYPDDLKAPDSLLKLGLAYQGLGERKAACNAYDELLTKYPKAIKALRDRAQFEKSRGKCT
jgi:tol-pal system protein YbgF